jgi:hypothetical protein
MHVDSIYVGQLALASTLRLKASSAREVSTASTPATWLRWAIASLTKYR